MSPKQQEQSKPLGSLWRAVRVLGALGVAIAVVAVASLAIAMSRGGGTDCGSLAWNSVPDASRLPSGWSLASNQVFVNNLTTTLLGPVPSGSTQRPAVYVSVSCYGSDASLALRRAHEGALAAGATDLSLTATGEEFAAVTNAIAGTVTLFARRGVLLAGITAPASLDQSVLSVMGATVDAAMVHAIAVGPTGSPLPQPSQAPATPTPSPVPESHAVPDLEALLPHTVEGAAMTTQSTLGTTALGTNAASQSLISALQKLGRTPADLDYAVAYDAAGKLDLRLFAYRVKGVGISDLGPAVVASQMADPTQKPASSQVTLGGHAITEINYSTGTRAYIYPLNGVVYVIGTSDESIATAVVGLLR